MCGGMCLRAALVGVVLLSGCTRCYYREKSDKVVDQLLEKKDQYPQWQIEAYHVYPDPRARFADPTNPDRPPMPPDDPAAKALSPNPQKPYKKAGIAYIEGDGWLELLEQWNAENRAQLTQRQEEDDRPPDWQGGTSESQRRAEPTPAENLGYLINLVQSSVLGLINSRDFQTRREDLYLAALPVTLERFAFLPQCFALGSALREYTGREMPEGQHNRWRLDSETGLTQFFPTGALLLFRLANRTVIEMAGNFVPRLTSQSSITFDLIQPFLRGGGFAVNLEPLTQAERDLVYAIRRYARFRKEFFVALAGGGNIAGGPLVPRGFESLNLTVGLFTPSEGYLPTVLRQGQLAVERQNVATLEEFLRRFQAFEEGGEVSQLQVDQVELQLLQGRSSVLRREQDYRDSLDRFKLFLGIPPSVPLELDEEPLRGLNRQMRRFTELIAQFEDARAEASLADTLADVPRLRARLQRLFVTVPLVEGTRFQQQILDRWSAWERLPALDLHGVTRPQLQLGGLLSALPLGPLHVLPWYALPMAEPTISERLSELRRERRRLLDLETDLAQKDQSLSAADQQRLQQLDGEIYLGEMEQLLRNYEAEPWRELPDPDRRQRQRIALFRVLIDRFVLVLGDARQERIEQVRRQWPDLPPTIVCGVDVISADLELAYDVVSRAALTYRLDLMNQRGLLVDAWRKIKVSANALLGVFNIRYHLESFTPFQEAQPFAFGGSRSRQQLFLDGELPLVRLPERNFYRATLIGFQRQRRALMAAEDRVVADVRAELRQLRVLAENYRIQQRAVELAYFQVENALDTFQAPPAPTGAAASISTAASAAALTQQLLNAQRSLPQAQNELLSTWINYQIARLQLYRDMELMKLDSQGVWIDECANHEQSTDAALSSSYRDQRRTGEQPEYLPPPRRVPPADPGVEPEGAR